jgi:hypothetical protein
MLVRLVQGTRVPVQVIKRRMIKMPLQSAQAAYGKKVVKSVSGNTRVV